MADSFERVGADLVVRDFSRQGVTGFMRSMRDVRREVGGVQRILGTAFGVGAGYLGTAGLVAGYKSLVNAAREAAQGDKLFRASMGDTAQAAREWSAQVAESVGATGGQVRENLAGYKMMAENMGLTETQALSMAQAMTQLTFDMASFRGIKPEEAFAGLQSALSGSGESLRRFGIIIKESQVEQYAVDQGWIQHGQTLSEVGKLYARFGLIVQQTVKDQGDAARSAGDAEGVTRSLTAAWAEQKRVIGEQLLPTYVDLTKAIRDSMKDNADFVRTQVEGLMAIYDAAHLVTTKIREERMPQSYYNNAMEQYRQTVGSLDPNAFRLVEGSFGGLAEQPPKFPKKYQEILNRYKSQWEMDQYSVAAPTTPAPPSATGLPGAYQPAPYPRVELPPLREFADNTKEEGKATQQATDFVRKHIQALRDEYDMIGQRNTGYDDARNYLETQRAILALTDQEVDSLLEELRTRQQLDTLTGKRKDLADEMKRMQTEVDATNLVRKHIQALRDEYDMIGRINLGYDDAQSYVETQRAILALTDQEVDSLLEELRTRQQIGRLTGKREELAEEMEGMSEQLRKAQLIKKAMEDLSGTLTDIAFDWENASQYMDRYFDELARNTTRELVMRPFTNALGGVIASALGIGPQGMGTPLPNQSPSFSGTTAAVAHAGGVVGRSSFPTRYVPTSAFADAPRMHGGGRIGPGEVPIIAKEGETITPAGARAGPANLRVQIKNEAGAPVEARSADMSFDAGEMVVNLVLNDFTQGGRTRDYLRR